MSTKQLTPGVTAAGSGIGRASGFELPSPGQAGAANIEAALERNRAFAAAGGHHGAVVFPNLSLFVISCLDPRVDPAHFPASWRAPASAGDHRGSDGGDFIGARRNALPDGQLEVAVIHQGSGPARSPGGRQASFPPAGGAYATADRRRRGRPCRNTAASTPWRPSPAVNASTPPRDPPRVAVSGHVYDVLPGLVQALRRRRPVRGDRGAKPFHRPKLGAQGNAANHFTRDMVIHYRCNQRGLKPEHAERLQAEAANPWPRSGRYDPPRCLRPVTCGTGDGARAPIRPEWGNRVMSNDTSWVPSRPRVEAAWAATGALTVVLFGCGLLFGDLLGTTNYPALNASSFQLRQYFTRNVSEARALSLFHLLAAAALAAFASYLYPTLRAAGMRLAALALADGIIGAAFLALSALCYRVLAERSVAGDPALAHGLLVLSYLAGGPAIGVPLALTAGAFAAAIRRERTLPGWLWWLSTVAAVLGIATVTTLLGPTNNSSAAYGLLLLGAVALFAWLAASSAVLLGRTLRAEDRAVDPR